MLGPCETALIEKKVHLQKNPKKWPRPDVETATIVNFFQLPPYFECFQDSIVESLEMIFHFPLSEKKEHDSRGVE